MCDLVIERYTTHPRYLKIEGASYFSIYQPQTLIDSLGSDQAAGAAIDRFRERVAAAGLGDLHLNLVASNRGVLPREIPVDDLSPLLKTLQASSVTS